MTGQTAEADVRELSRAWIAAELSGDPTALERVTTDDFHVVGPVGFVLDRDQWTARYREGAFAASELTCTDVSVRIHADAAISIGVHTQKATHQGNPVDGRFRATHVAVREGGRWRLAGMHLSPIGGPPPFTPRAAEGHSDEPRRTGP